MKLYSILNSKVRSFTIIVLFLPLFGLAQKPKVFTHADTLRGSITPERAWWDVQRYDITVKPDYNSKTISGENVITYKVVKDSKGIPMQIDLQEPLLIDSIFLNGHTPLAYSKEGNAIPLVLSNEDITIKSLSDKNQDLKIASVELVGSKEKIKWSQGEDGLIIKAVNNFPSKYAAVFKIKFIQDKG